MKYLFAYFCVQNNNNFYWDSETILLFFLIDFSNFYDATDTFIFKYN